MINDLPTVFEVVSGEVKNLKDRAEVLNSCSKSKSNGKMVRPSKNMCFRFIQFIFVFYRGGNFNQFRFEAKHNPTRFIQFSFKLFLVINGMIWVVLFLKPIE